VIAKAAFPVNVPNEFVRPILQIFNVESASKNRTRVSVPAVADAATVTLTLLSSASDGKMSAVLPPDVAVTPVTKTPPPVSCTLTVPAGTAIGALH
jgi:L-lactate utilization protein LutC